MKMTSTKNGNSNSGVKESPKTHFKPPIKIASENLIATSTMSSSKTSNFLYKAKQRNSAANNIANPNPRVNGTDNREKLSVSQLNNNSNLSKVKRVSDISQIKDVKFRRDAKGIPIIKGRKKHRISFIDIQDKNANLVDIVEIESFKEYNARELTILEEKQTTLNGNLTRNSNDNTSCACIIF